jgi:hypothetical protein
MVYTGFIQKHSSKGRKPMIDLDTFITILYVMVDDFCQQHPELQPSVPGPAASLSLSEAITLALIGQWGTFPSERAFYRFAEQRLHSAFPGLPARSQFNRQMRRHRDAIIAFGQHLLNLMDAQNCPYEVIDSTGVAVRHYKRRKTGWLAGQANIGWSNRLGWYHGFHLLLSVTPSGAITGYGFGPASTNDKRLAQTLFGARLHPTPRLLSAGQPAQHEYVADKGFAGKPERGKAPVLASVITAPHPTSAQHWPKALRRWLAGLRQIIETVNDKLLNTFRLDRERPHDLTGFQARLAAKVSLYTFCQWLNAQLGRASLAFADLIAW